MARSRRLGVALVLSGRPSVEIDGLRRALGDHALGTVDPHVTLVSPVNVAPGHLGEAVSTLRRAACGASGPLVATLGPLSTFLPDSPVLYLEVDENTSAALGELRRECLRGPLQRPGRWPFVPHVTLCDEISSARAEAAITALSAYQVDATLDRLVLLEQYDGAWHEVADAMLGAPDTWGRGGIETRAVVGRVPGPDVLELFDSAGGRPWATTGPVPGAAQIGDTPVFAAQIGDTRVPHVAQTSDMVVLTALRQRPEVGGTDPWSCAGAAVAWTGPPGSGLPHVCVVVAEPWRRQGLGRMLVTAVADAAKDRGWSSARAIGHGPHGFFSASTPWVAELGD